MGNRQSCLLLQDPVADPWLCVLADDGSVGAGLVQGNHHGRVASGLLPYIQDGFSHDTGFPPRIKYLSHLHVNLRDPPVVDLQHLNGRLALQVPARFLAGVSGDATDQVDVLANPHELGVEDAWEKQ